MKRNIVLLFVASLFVLFMFSCSTDVSGIAGSTLEPNEVSVLKPLTDAKIKDLLKKEVWTAEEFAQLKSSYSSESASRTPTMTVVPHVMRVATNVYTVHGWYILNQNFDLVLTELIVGEEMADGSYRRIKKEYGSRAPAFAGAHRDTIAWNVYVPQGRGMVVQIVEGFVNGTKITEMGIKRF